MRTGHRYAIIASQKKTRWPRRRDGRALGQEEGHEEQNTRPFFRYRYPARFVRLFIGLVLFGLSSALNVRSMLGLSPWNAFHQGLSLVSGLSIGRITQLCGIVIIGIDLLMREPIGFGTIFNMILVGGSLDFFLASGLIPETNSLLWRTVLLLLGIFVTALGSYLYMSAAMGAGPRDSMMVGLAKRLPRVPVGIVRNMIELTALAIGWWLGGVVGVGTVAFALLTGPVMQWVFQLFSFDVRSLHAETLLETVGIWTGRRTVERGETKQACAGDEAGCGRPDQGQGVLPEVD